VYDIVLCITVTFGKISTGCFYFVFIYTWKSE